MFVDAAPAWHAEAMIDAGHPLLLASGSPRRRELLARVGVPLEVRPVAVDEAVRPGEAAEAYLSRVVDDKRRAALAVLSATRCRALLVADTAVVCAGEILGKPAGDDDAARMLRRLAGRDHEVSTRFALAGAATHAATVTTRVWFRPLDDAHIARYVASGEGRDKAGGYAIQGIGAMLVRRVEGSYSNVVGLPLCEVIEALQALGWIGALP